MSPINAAVLGAITALYLVASLFFFRYSRKTGDALFKYFGFAFSLLAIERIVWLAIGSANEFQPIIYLFRLVAFLMIIAAILKKNRGSTHS